LYQQFAVTIAISVIFSHSTRVAEPALSALLLRPKKPSRDRSSGPSMFNRGFGRATDAYVSFSAILIRKAC